MKQRDLSEMKLSVKILNINTAAAGSANIEPHQLLKPVHVQPFDRIDQTLDREEVFVRQKKFILKQPIS